MFIRRQRTSFRTLVVKRNGANVAASIAAVVKGLYTRCVIVLTMTGKHAHV